MKMRKTKPLKIRKVTDAETVRAAARLVVGHVDQDGLAEALAAALAAP